MGATAMATGEGGVSEVLTSMCAMETDESSRAVTKESVATALDVSASQLSSTTYGGPSPSQREETTSPRTGTLRYNPYRHYRCIYV